jgi:polyhydroxyalkanoate synthesis repressor PhaR
MPKVSSPSADASGTEDKGDAKQRVIKKYPNRRLYDTRSSSYVTLAEIKRLIIDHVPVVVRDAKTNEDLTRSIFLQIILEEEAGGAPMFDEAVLAQMIRFHGHAMQGFLGPYLEKNMQTMMELQARFAEQVAGPNPQPWPTMRSNPKRCSAKCKKKCRNTCSNKPSKCLMPWASKSEESSKQP